VDNPQTVTILDARHNKRRRSETKGTPPLDSSILELCQTHKVPSKLETSKW